MCKINDKPLVSVIVPMYNCGEYIEKCLKSLINQTYENIEIIVIDDGSTDNGREICGKISESDDRICLIGQKNGGVSSARNKGLECAHGDWITFCDSDDYADKELIEHLLGIAQAYDADIAQCGVIMEYADRPSRQMPAPKRETLIDDFVQADINILRYYGKTVYPKLFKSKLIEKLEFDAALTIGEDLLFGVRAALKARKIIMTGEYKYHYFQRDGSACNSVPDEKSLFSSADALNEISELLPKNSKAAEFYFNERLRNNFDICSRYVRYKPQNTESSVAEIRRELEKNLERILKSPFFSPKEKLKARLIVNSWGLYSKLIGMKGKRERCL